MIQTSALLKLSCIAGLSFLTAVLEANAQSDGVPRGMVAFFNTNNCPVGWELDAPSVGRLLLAGDAASRGTTSGDTPMTSGIDPTHTHDAIASLSINEKPSVDDKWPFPHKTVAHKQTARGTATSSSAGSNLPYIAFLVCKKSATSISDALPIESQAFFDLEKCPAGWVEYTNSQNRFVLARPKSMNIGLISDAGPTNGGHSHSATLSYQIPERGLTNGPGGESDTGPGGTFAAQAILTTNSTPLVPSITYLSCTKSSSNVKPPNSELPTEMIFFVGSQECGEGTEEVPSAAGRFVVGAEPGWTNGTVFGGDPFLKDTEWQNKHSHPLSMTIGLITKRIRSDEGHDYHLGDGLPQVTASTQSLSSSAGIPYIALSLCEVSAVGGSI
ncbi:MAG: hypothetical protein NPIRA05_01370 [Nitrospirales bacterium]|nr:MAG: hypothetical protein NPIRA05_01370 [Nitrospirales bacterium]